MRRQMRNNASDPKNEAVKMIIERMFSSIPQNNLC